MNSLKLKIALLQILPCDNKNDNLKKGIEYCIKAKKENPDIILFPEMYNCGYKFDDLSISAINKNDDFILKFKELAKQLNLAIGITYLLNDNNKYKNTITLFDRFGEEVYTYSKVHTCDFGDEKVLTRGDDFYVKTLNTKIVNIKVGSMICYDREFPESARIMMLKGAELLLVPNACPMEINRLSQLRGRAYENMLGIVTVNYPLGKPDCNGHSTAFDGVAYLPELEGSRDTMLIDCGETEGIYFVEFDMDMIRRYRSAEVHGNSYRKPEKYKILTNCHIDFLKSNIIKLTAKEERRGAF